MNRTKQKAAVPKARCEFLIPDELDARLEAIRRKVGVSRTSLLVAAVEQFVYGEETRTGVDGLHERLAHMMVRLRADILEIRAHLDTAMQEDKRGGPGQDQRLPGHGRGHAGGDPQIRQDGAGGFPEGRGTGASPGATHEKVRLALTV